MAQFEVLPHGAAEVESIAPGHEQIADDHVGPMLDGERKAVLAVLGFDDIPVRRTEHGRRRRAAQVIVVDEQDGSLHHVDSLWIWLNPFRTSGKDKDSSLACVGWPNAGNLAP